MPAPMCARTHFLDTANFETTPFAALIMATKCVQLIGWRLTGVHLSV